MARPKVHDEVLRGRLLERARTLLSTAGPAGLSLRTLARDCDTSTTAVYSLFGGKAGLLTALFDEAFRSLGRQLSAVQPGEDSLDDIVRLGLAYRRSALDDPHVFGMMFAGDTVLPAAAEARTAAGTALGPLREFVERAVQSKALRPDTDPAAARSRCGPPCTAGCRCSCGASCRPAPSAASRRRCARVLDGWRPATP